jgi:hypothetical protein
MITIEVKHENDNGREWGYGIYVNAYVKWDDDPGALPVRYASECVPFGRNTPANLRAAERRVRRQANDIARKEYVGE